MIREITTVLVMILCAAVLWAFAFHASAHECAPQGYYEEQQDNWEQQRRLAREQQRQMEDMEMRQINMEQRQILEQFENFGR